MARLVNDRVQVRDRVQHSHTRVIGGHVYRFEHKHSQREGRATFCFIAVYREVSQPNGGKRSVRVHRLVWQGGAS
jgi:hypothetical protein